jgi:hypothetical protein
MFLKHIYTVTYKSPEECSDFMGNIKAREALKYVSAERF